MHLQYLKLQEKLAGKVVTKDSFESIKTVCAVDVSYKNKMAFASAVIVDKKTLQIIEHIDSKSAVTSPYVPGLLFLREAPPAMAALGQKQLRSLVSRRTRTATSAQMWTSMLSRTSFRQTYHWSCKEPTLRQDQKRLCPSRRKETWGCHKNQKNSVCKCGSQNQLKNCKRCCSRFDKGRPMGARTITSCRSILKDSKMISEIPHYHYDYK